MERVEKPLEFLMEQSNMQFTWEETEDWDR